MQGLRLQWCAVCGVVVQEIIARLVGVVFVGVGDDRLVVIGWFVVVVG